MKARTWRVAGCGAALALVAAPGRAHDPKPDAVEQEPSGEDRAPPDVTGRLRADANGLSLEVGGAVVELRITGGELALGDSPGDGVAGIHDLRASISVDGKTTNLHLRIVPPKTETPAPKK
jgi:hypothetical protein